VVRGRFDHVVLGVGVNLGAAPAGVPGAAVVGDVDPATLLECFLGAFACRYEPAHPAFADAVLAVYRTECGTLGRVVRATTTRGSLVEGEAVDVDETGALVVRTREGLETVRFGEVEHLDA
jgi:BirA family biotin operon repressor/biotin-[acetyl-CoA-carboxylase] ligase